MRSVLFFICILIPMHIATLAADSLELRRLDPHGSKSLKLRLISLQENKECKACHFEKNKKLELKESIPQRCVSCHNKSPHSGVLEHMGKILHRVRKDLKGEITCLSCHRPHRAWIEEASKIQKALEKRTSVLEKIEESPSFLQVKKETLKMENEFIERHTPDAMIKYSCVDCHRW